MCFIGFYRDVHVNLFIWVFPKIGVGPKMDGLFHGSNPIFQWMIWGYHYFWKHPYLGGGFKYFLFSSLFGEDEPILTSIFFKWVVQPPTRYPIYSYLFVV